MSSLNKAVLIFVLTKHVDTGSSILLGAYLAGLTLSYMASPPHGTSDSDLEQRVKALSFEDAHVRTIRPIQQYILAPLFFASIGYAIVSVLFIDCL